MDVVKVQNIPGRFNIALIIARSFPEVTQKLLASAMQRLIELDFHSAQITEAWVPDVIDLPLTAQRLARTGKFEAIICLGCIIIQDANTSLSEQVNNGCQQVALNNDIPVIVGVLTAENLEQAYKRTTDNKNNPGRNATDAAFELISVLRQI